MLKLEDTRKDRKHNLIHQVWLRVLCLIRSESAAFKDGDQKLSGSDSSLQVFSVFWHSGAAVPETEESFQQVEEIVVSNDPEQRRLKFKVRDSVIR